MIRFVELNSKHIAIGGTLRWANRVAAGDILRILLRGFFSPKTGNPLRFNSLNRRKLAINMRIVAKPTPMHKTAITGSDTTCRTGDGEQEIRR
jgi:hypothetical protein